MVLSAEENILDLRLFPYFNVFNNIKAYSFESSILDLFNTNSSHDSSHCSSMYNLNSFINGLNQCIADRKSVV